MGGGRAGADDPALQVIVLGSGGGPLESNVTAFLVRSLSSGWRKGSVIAVDAGVHLSAIHRILESTQPPDLGQTEALSLPYTLTSGPFAGLELPHASAAANAAHVHRSLIDTYLITHPHLDHISGFVINTAGLPGSRPKRLAGLPSTIAAFKTHIFNNVIWPNLSDENNGAGLVTYMRLVEGGSPALGDGDGKGYLEMSDDLSVKIWGVSHGHCVEKHSHRGSGSSAPRYGSLDMGPVGVGMGGSMSAMMSPRILAHHNAANPSLGSYLQQQSQGQSSSGMLPGSAAPSGGRSSSVPGGLGANESICVYDSSAYFLRDVPTGREVLIFGDVEPDSVSLSPRNLQVWQEAAPKIASGKLAAIFIECSYDDSQSVDRLFGHLTPRFIAEEMAVLAQEVEVARLLRIQEKEAAVGSAAMDRGRGSASGSVSGSDKKRKRELDDGVVARRKAAATRAAAAAATTLDTGSQGAGQTSDDPVSPKTVRPSKARTSGGILDDAGMLGSPHLSTPTAAMSLRDATPVSLSTPATPMHDASPGPPLRGLKVVIIHVKDKFNDAEPPGETILAELLDYESAAQLGCEYIISQAGQDFLL